MKRILLISSALVAVLLLSSCSFHDIESNKSIITTTTVDSNSTGFVPEGTTTPSSTNTPTTDSTENPDSKDGYPVKMKTTANVNARAGASTVDEILKILPEGTEINVTGDSGEWYKIDVDGKEAFVIKEYVKVVE